jgi:hypothetical protein
MTRLIQGSDMRLVQGSAFVQRSHAAQPQLYVVSIGENDPSMWGTSAKAFWKLIVQGDGGNVQVVRAQYESMKSEIDTLTVLDRSGRPLRFKSIQDYYARSPVVTPIFRACLITINNKTVMALLVHAPDFREVPYPRAMSLLVSLYRIAVMMHTLSGTHMEIAPLSAGAFATDPALHSILRTCYNELRKAPGFVDLYLYGQKEWDYVSSLSKLRAPNSRSTSPSTSRPTRPRLPTATSQTSSSRSTSPQNRTGTRFTRGV